MLICPGCDHTLTSTAITTEGEGKMEIDHCYFCGGVWFDHYEINRYPLTEAISLLRTTTSVNFDEIKSSGKCPLDNTLLEEIRTESVPSDIKVLACSKCGGNFITKIDLVNLKRAQKVKLDYFKTWKIPIPRLASIMLPVLFITMATVGVFFTVKNVQQNQEARIKAAELIGVPSITVSSRNTVLVSFTTTVPMFSSVVYKNESEAEPHTVPVSKEQSKYHAITIQNLSPKTNYTFKLYVENAIGEVLSSPTYVFTTN